MPRVCAPLVACLAWLIAAAAIGQQLPQAWIDESNAAMRRHRTAPLRVVVLNAEGSPVPGAVVQATQTGHDLPLGFVADRSGLDGLPLDAPVYRHFNTVSLDRLVAWPDAHPRRNAEHPMLAARRVAHQARQAGLAIRLGPVASQDPAHNPDWVVDLPPADLAAALLHRTDAVLDELVAAAPGTQVDLLADGLSHQSLTRALGPQVRRLLFDHARAAAPRARLAVRFANALTGHRRTRLPDAVAALREDFIDADLIALEEHIKTPLQRAPLQRAVDAIDSLGYGLTLASLDVGGPTPEAAAYQLELLLRTLVPSPACAGVVFNTVVTPLPDAPRVPGRPAPLENAGLIDTAGQLTPAGRVVEHLFGEQWRSDEFAVTDAELAAANLTLFAGTYTLTVMLPPTDAHPEGQTFTYPLHLPASTQTRLAVVQPLRVTTD
ncbi:MAG: hypothetical protein AAGI54_12335 [Planctomycetota bacterium]